MHDKINRDVEKNLTSRYLDIGAHQMTTDDLLDQLIYAIVQARSREKRAAAIHAQVARRRNRIRARGTAGDLASILSDPEDSDESNDAHDDTHEPLSLNGGSDRVRGQRGKSRSSDPTATRSNYSEGLDSSSRPGMLNWMRRLSLKRSFLATNVAYMQ